MNVAETLRGKRILFVGATGFVGKVALSLLLRRYPDLDKVFVLVRPGAGSTSEQAPSQGGGARCSILSRGARLGLETFLRQRVVPLPGDAARPDLNFGPADLERFGKVDAIVNCAGLVSFSPSLETALRINTLGVRYVRDLARKIGAGVVHISTCFVAGNRSEPYGGEVWEDDPHGYYPRRGELRDDDFDVDAEIADCERIIATQDRPTTARKWLFRERAARRLRDDGRDPDDAQPQADVARESSVDRRQAHLLGMERAKQWGGPTSTLPSHSATRCGSQHVTFAILRPSVRVGGALPIAGVERGSPPARPWCPAIKAKPPRPRTKGQPRRRAGDPRAR